MLTFFLKGGKDECRTFVKALKVVTLAESLGGYESLVKIPLVLFIPTVVYKTIMLLICVTYYVQRTYARNLQARHSGQFDQTLRRPGIC